MYTVLAFLTVFLSLLVVFVMALRFGPLFACVDAGNTLAGHFLGLLYSLIWYVRVVIILIYRNVKSDHHYLSVCLIILIYMHYYNIIIMQVFINFIYGYC